MAGVCRTYGKVRIRSGAWRHKTPRCTIPGGTTGVLGVMVMPYHSEHRWSRVGAVYASDVCQFRDIYLRPTLNIVAINFVFVIELFIIVYYSHKKIISPI